MTTLRAKDARAAVRWTPGQTSQIVTVHYRVQGKQYHAPVKLWRGENYRAYIRCPACDKGVLAVTISRFGVLCSRCRSEHRRANRPAEPEDS